MAEGPVPCLVGGSHVMDCLGLLGPVWPDVAVFRKRGNLGFR